MRASRAALSLVAVLVVAGSAAASPARPAGTGLAALLPDDGGRIVAAVDAALGDLTWMAIDGHLHTDHSHDAGLPHQQDGTPQSHDTFLDEQRDQAIRVGMDAIAFTDHRTFGQHYDPDFQTGDAILMTGEEWGGSRHGTALGIVEVLEHGPDSRVGCGVAEMAFEAAAQDAMLGIAHPSDGKVGCIDLPSFAGVPMSHVEALRGGNGPAQDLGLAEPNGSNIDFYVRLLQAGGRVAAFNGSDNHFKQVWPGPSGPGGSATYALVQARSDPGLREAIRARRTIAGLGTTGPRVTTLLDADRDGDMDALTGGWAAPTGTTVTVALRVEQGSGSTVQLFDDRDELVAQEPVVLPDQTLAFEVPSSSYYRAVVLAEPVARTGAPDPLDYADVVLTVSTPVWTAAPALVGAAPLVGGAPATALSGASRCATAFGCLSAAWSGFARLARDGGVVHAVWQERRVAEYAVVTARSDDSGLTWRPPVVLSRSTDARLPAVAAGGGHVTVAWEEHDQHQFGGDIVAATSTDGGASYPAPVVVADGNATRPAVVAADGTDHLAWTQQGADGVWGIRTARRTTGGWSAPQAVSTAVARVCCQTTYAVPPRTLVHVPASVTPAIAVRGATVVVAWEDNRDDPTPLRNGNPDDWGLWTAVSTDGGVSFGPDLRATPRHPRTDNPADAEGVEGNPARNADLAVAPDGALLLTYTDPVGAATPTVYVQRSTDGAVWEPPVAVGAPDAEWDLHPRLVVAGSVVSVVWQRSADPQWSLVSAESADGGRTFGTPGTVTTGARYAGWPSVVDGLVAFTAETPGGFAVHAGALHSG